MLISGFCRFLGGSLSSALRPFPVRAATVHKLVCRLPVAQHDFVGDLAEAVTLAYVNAVRATVRITKHNGYFLPATCG